MTTEEQPGISFAGFVISLATTAAVHFGDLADPNTGERQVPGDPKVGFTQVYGAPGVSACTVVSR